MRQQTQHAIDKCLFMTHPPKGLPEVKAPPEMRREVQRMVVVGREHDIQRAVIEGIKLGVLIALTLAALFL